MRFLTTALFLVCGITLISAPLAGQSPFNPRGGFRLRGEVVSEDAAIPVNGLQVELTEMSSLPRAYSALTSATGAFTIDGFMAGSYGVSVFTGSGRLLHRTLATVNTMSGQLTIALPRSDGDRPVTGTISVSRLRHKVPGKVLKAFRRASKAIEGGDMAKAETQLRKAIEIDPDFYEAHVVLGSILLNRNDLQESLDHFDRAAKLDPSASEPQAKAAVALYRVGARGEAESAARHAITLDESSTLAHFVLGALLVEQSRSLEDALLSVNRAKRDYEKAYLVAAEAYQKLGRYEDAKAELEQYLTIETAPRRSAVQSWLCGLRKSHPTLASTGDTSE